jgi:hypothetical protein
VLARRETREVRGLTASPRLHAGRQASEPVL